MTERDRYDRLLSYVWIEQGADATPVLVNEKLVRQGYAVVSTYPPDVQHVDAFERAQRLAVRQQRGLWGACGGADTQAEASSQPAPQPAPVVTDCAAFAGFDAANAYYASRPDAQPYLDPNGDGRACEDWFGVDQPAPAPGGGYAFPAYDVDCPQVSYDEAQWILAQDPSDPYCLDGDNDGIACEANR